MAFSILSDDIKSKLEEERSRLIEERDSIVQEAVEQATAEVDQMLQQLNRMLGYDDSAVETNETETAVTTKKPKQAKQATSRKPSAEVAPTSKASTKGSAKTRSDSSKAKSTASGQTLTLKQEFRSGTPTEAVKQIIAQAGKPLTTDEVIQSLYQSVQESDLSNARKSVALILGRGAHQGIYEKVAENPSRFQLKS